MDGELTRRAAIRTAAGAAVGAAAVGTATAQSTDFGGWFDNVSNFDGVVDRTGQSEVTVTVGAAGNGGNLAFGPAAIRVDPGTTVTWEWNGKGGAHNVIAEEGTFDSGSAVSEAGTTFEYTFESEGQFLYYCDPHEIVGMKGAVVVGGSGGDGGGGGGSEQVYGPAAGDKPTLPMLGAAAGLLAMLAAPIVYGATRGYEPVVGGTSAVLEADEPDPETRLGHDEFDPSGTLSLVLVYMGILVVMWLFMYFVEFLGGPTVIGSVASAVETLAALGGI
jgi:halocyanin-like protein